jgi:hypothetical protein
MTTKVPWQYPGKKQTTHATTGDLALAGLEPVAESDAQKASQIVKQLKGGFAMPNSEINQTFNTSHLPEDEFDSVGQAAMLANVEYYQALCAKARASHAQYLKAMTAWQERLDRLKKPL